MARLTKKAILAAKVIHGGVFAVVKASGERSEQEIASDEVPYFRQKAEKLVAGGGFVSVAVRVWTFNPLLPVGSQCGVEVEQFVRPVEVAKPKKKRTKKAAALVAA